MKGSLLAIRFSSLSNDEKRKLLGKKRYVSPYDHLYSDDPLEDDSDKPFALRYGGREYKYKQLEDGGRV
jgi:hypothetical protein